MKEYKGQEIYESSNPERMSVSQSPLKDFDLDNPSEMITLNKWLDHYKSKGCAYIVTKSGNSIMLKVWVEGVRAGRLDQHKTPINVNSQERLERHNKIVELINANGGIKEVAKKINIGHSCVNAWFYGRTLPSKETVSNIKKVYDVEI